MRIEYLDKHNSLHYEESNRLLQENFGCWSDMQSAKDEIDEICLPNNITLK